MRTIIAMICAAAAAAYCTFSISENVASNLVSYYRFDNPDAVANLHATAFMATNLLGLAGGWLAGWVLGWPFRRRPPA